MVRVLLRKTSVILGSTPSLGRKKLNKSENLSAGGEVQSGKRGDIRIAALHDISLSLKAGDRLGILGRNGSGKTTLLKTMAGIYPPHSGLVAVEGKVATLFNMGLGMNVDASGYENIILSGLVAGLKQDDIIGMVDEIADFTGLGDFLELPVRTYSQGMAMRLKFACATAFKADILLLDEWLGAGDASFQDKASHRMKHLVKNSGIVVLATHNPKLMQKVCNRAILLDRGRIIKRGSVDEVMQHAFL